jgi:DNA-binding transcriptional regulator LsrR (DeoR family)
MDQAERLERLRALYTDLADRERLRDIARASLASETTAALAAGVKQSEIARACGVSRQAVQQWIAPRHERSTQKGGGT